MFHRPSYSLRALLLAVTAVAVALGLWTRHKQFHDLAARHHFESLDHGYAAAAIQRPVDPEWEWKYPSLLRMDRERVSAAAPLWQQSMHHARLRDLYRAASRHPWMPLGTIPPPPKPLILPEDDDQLPNWCEKQFGIYWRANACLMDDAMGFSSVDDANLTLAQELFTPDDWERLSTRFRVRRPLYRGP